MKPASSTYIWFTPRDDLWRVVWRGQEAPATFQSRCAALAYIATCEAAGRLRA